MQTYITYLYHSRNQSPKLELRVYNIIVIRKLQPFIQKNLDQIIEQNELISSLRVKDIRCGRCEGW